jgi:hypothetical protein
LLIYFKVQLDQLLPYLGLAITLR